MPFDIHPDLTVEELIFIKELKEAYESFVKEQEEQLEMQLFAFQFEWKKIKDSYEEVTREANKRTLIMERLLKAKLNPEEVPPIENPAQYINTESPARDRIDLLEILPEREQGFITKQREQLQPFLEEAQQKMRNADIKIAIILRNFPGGLQYIDGMQYKVIDLPANFNQLQL